MSLLRFFLSYNRIPLILFTLFGFFFNLFYNTNILGIDDNIHLIQKLEPFDKHGHVSKAWFYNTMTLTNCVLGVSMAVFHSLAMSSILFNAKYRVVSVLVHFLRIRNIICPLITIFGEIALFHDQMLNMSGLQSKIMHQSNAQLVPTILYGLAAIMLYATYDRYLMEIRLIFDYLTLSLRCTRGLSPLEEQTYICEAINLHACRETMVLEQREKVDRDLRELLRKEKDRINRERMERTRVEEQRLQRVKYVSNLLPQMMYFLRTVFGLQRLGVDEENIPPSIRTGIEKQKDELRICAAKTMCCNIQKHFKDKNSILPNCLQGISRGKINLCDLKEKDLCSKNTCGTGGGGVADRKNRHASVPANGCNNNNFQTKINAAVVKKDEVCVAECQRQTDDQRAKAKKKEMERERKEQEKCERELRARQIKCEKEELKRRQKREEEECEDNDGAVSIFNDLPRTDLVMNCEIKRVLDPDCQEVLRCKEVIVPPPLCAVGDKGAAGCGGKAGGGGGGAKRSPSGPRQSPVGQPFGTATNCNQMGMAQRMQPIYQCANSVITKTDTSCATGTTNSCSTNSCSTNNNNNCNCNQIIYGNKGRQMDGMFSSMTSMTSTPTNGQFGCCQKEQQKNKCDDTCARMMAANQCGGMGQQQSSSLGSAFITARSQPTNKTSVQAIPVQVTLTEGCNYPIGTSLGASQMAPSSGTGPMMTANSFSNAGAAKPLEAHTKKDICNDPMFMGLQKQPGRFSDLMQMNNNDGQRWRTPGSFARQLNDDQPENWRSPGSFLKHIKQEEMDRFGGRGCREKACKNINCSQLRGRSTSHSPSKWGGTPMRTGPPMGSPRSSSMGPTGGAKSNCCSKCNTMRGSGAADPSTWFGNISDVTKRSTSMGPSNTHRSSDLCSKKCDDTGLSRFNNSKNCGCDSKKATNNNCTDSGLAKFNAARKDGAGQCASTSNNCEAQACNACNRARSKTRNADDFCRLKGGAEETTVEDKASKSLGLTVAKPLGVPVVSSVSNKGSTSINNNNNKLTETKREVFKTVTNIDDPSGKVIRKECDTVIEEILHSSAVPGESKTMREVTVEKNIIQEANKTIREESHNTREEIINFEMDSAGHMHPYTKASDEFENRKQRLDMMRRMGNANHDRHVSEERHIYGRLKGSPDLTEVQSEAEIRSRVDTHRMGLKGGSVEKRGQSEASLKSGSEEGEEIKRESPTPRAQSEAGNNKSADRYYEKGDFCREFTAHLEKSPYGELITELKGKLVSLATPEEMHKILEQIVLLQTEALVSFVPREGKKFPRDLVHFDPDLSYNALMKELKTVMKTNGNAVTVSRAIKDIDAINAEIERDMRKKMGTMQYLKDQEAAGYPNHYAFAHLIRELREKIKDYEDGALSSRSDEEVETQEQRRQRIEVLRDELENRKNMLGLSQRRGATVDAEKSTILLDTAREPKRKVAASDRKEEQKAQTTSKQVTIREPTEGVKRTKKSSKKEQTLEENIYMDRDGILSSSSVEDRDPIHRTPPTQELLQCSKDACKKRSKKERKKNTVAFSDEVQKRPTAAALPKNTNVKQIAQSLGNLMELMSRSNTTKTPKISMTIRPRKTNLSQDSDVTAVDAMSEASRKKTPAAEDKLRGGATHSSSCNPSKCYHSKIPKTPSNMKMNRAKSFDNIANKRMSGVVKQIRCGPTAEAVSRSSLMAAASPPKMKVDQQTNDAILEYLRNRGKSIKSPSSIMKVRCRLDRT